jgi:hypothetical protein
MHITPFYPRRFGAKEIRQVSWLMVIVCCTFPYPLVQWHSYSSLPFTVAGPRWNYTNFPIMKQRSIVTSASPDLMSYVIIPFNRIIHKILWIVNEI